MDEQATDYNGYDANNNDIIIDGCRLILTSIACPEQYEVFDEVTKKQIGYLRLRHGWFRADVPTCGGDTVYESNPQGDGIFEKDERFLELTNAVAAIKRHYDNTGKDSDDAAA